jgi:sec-independent protein translocase protein TatA
MPGWIGPWEILILLLIILLVFGPKRLPELGRSLGKGMREFKDSVSQGGHDKDEHEHDHALAELPAPVKTEAVESPPPREHVS